MAQRTLEKMWSSSAPSSSSSPSTSSSTPFNPYEGKGKGRGKKGATHAPPGGRGGGRRSYNAPPVPSGPPKVIRSEELEGGGSFTEVIGDLFKSTASLCHCVSVDLRMGKGVAVKFREDFGRVDELHRQNPKIGGVCTLHIPEEDRYIYYLITKEKASGKPTYEDLHLSLKAMAEHMMKHKVTKLAMPRIGCGLDRLVWDRVREMIKDVFKGAPVEIAVFHLDDPDK